MRLEDDGNHNVIPEDLSNYKVVKEGDLVINKMKTWQGSLGVSPHDGVVSPAYIVCDLSNDIDPKFAHYLLRCSKYIFVYNKLSYGVRVDQWDMHYEDFKKIPIHIPTLEEQQTIVRYLDEKLGQIDTFIHNKRRLIALLEEQKSALINQAVTKGLDEGVGMKDSKGKWAGEIPSHWKELKIKHLVSFKGGATPSKDESRYWNGTIPWVSPKDMKTFLIEQTEDFITEEGLEASSCSLIPPNSLLIVVRSGILKHSIPCALNQLPVALNQDMKALTCRRVIKPKFLAHLIKGKQADLLQLWRKVGATVESLEHEFITPTLIPVPPLAEQAEIIEYIENESYQVQKVIAKSNQEIDLINEYRTTLISEVVTGKVDVRGALRLSLYWKWRNS